MSVQISITLCSGHLELNKACDWLEQGVGENFMYKVVGSNFCILYMKQN